MGLFDADCTNDEISYPSDDDDDSRSLITNDQKPMMSLGLSSHSQSPHSILEILDAFISKASLKSIGSLSQFGDLCITSLSI